MNVPGSSLNLHRAFGAMYGAHGGARGHNPFPAPPKFNAHGARHVPEPVVHQLEINHQPQPWQKHAAKLKAKAIAHHLDWNARRVAREVRSAEARKVATIAACWSGEPVEQSGKVA